jgi:hypothetical protein
LGLEAQALTLPLAAVQTTTIRYLTAFYTDTHVLAKALIVRWGYRPSTLHCPFHSRPGAFMVGGNPMAIEQDIAKLLAARRQLLEQETRRRAQALDDEVHQRAAFAEAKVRVIIPALERARKALVEGQVESTWEEGEEERQGTGQMLRHSFAKFTVASEYVLIEWIGYRGKVRIAASRALNQAGNPSNDTETYLGLNELLPDTIEDHLLRTIRLALK